MKIEIQRLRAEGKSFRAIAAQLGIGKTTVAHHCDSEKHCREQRLRRQTLKRKLVDLFGGKCSSCGYNRSLSALDFHHLDPEQKEFAIARIGSFSKMVEEAKKCVLLCSNCHHEVHDGTLKISEQGSSQGDSH